MIQVSWNNGKESGFLSREAAERFMKVICKKVAPEKEYSIFTVYER
jgi:hypothetical protein